MTGGQERRDTPVQGSGTRDGTGSCSARAGLDCEAQEALLARLADELDGAGLEAHLVRAYRMVVRSTDRPGQTRVVWGPSVVVWTGGWELGTVAIGGRSGCFLVMQPDGRVEVVRASAQVAATLRAGTAVKPSDVGEAAEQAPGGVAGQVARLTGRAASISGMSREKER